MQCFTGAEGACGKGQKREITERCKETWGGDEFAYLNCGDSFTGIYLSKLIKSNISICAVYCIFIIPQ